MLRLFVILFVFLPACSLPQYTSRINYDDLKNAYEINIASDFSRCSKAGVAAYAQGKKFYEHWLRGGGTELSVFITAAELPEDTADIHVFCDDKQFKDIIRMRHSSFPLINALNARSKNLSELTEKYGEHIKMPAFYGEFKSFIMQSYSHFELGDPIYESLPVKYKTDILLAGLKQFPDRAFKDIVLIRVKALLEEPQAEEILETLLKDADMRYRVQALEILFQRPVKRLFARFFPIIYADKTLHPEFIKYLSRDASSEFAAEMFTAMKNAVEKGEKDSLMSSLFEIYAAGGADRTEYARKMLTSGNKQKEEMAVSILVQNPVDKDLAGYIRTHFHGFAGETRKALYPLVLSFYTADYGFFTELISRDDGVLRAELLRGCLGVKEKYESAEISGFYLREIEKMPFSGHALEYFIMEGAPDELLFEGLRRYLKNYPYDLNVLTILKDRRPEFYAAHLLRIAKEPLNPDPVRTTEFLSAYGERYFGEAVGMYEVQKDGEARINLLAQIVRFGSAGQRYGTKELLLLNKEGRKTMLKELAQVADAETTAYLFSKLETFDDEELHDVLRGFETGYKTVRIDCRRVERLFFEKKDFEVRRQVIWTMVFCCPDGYILFLEKVKNDENQALYVEAIEGFLDYLNILRPGDKKNAFLSMRDMYEKRKEKPVRQKVVEMLGKFGSAGEVPFLERLVGDAADEDEKTRMEQTLLELKKRP